MGNQAIYKSLIALCAAAGSLAAAAEQPVDFNSDIRPILSDRCFHCHGPDAAQRKADLRLDVEDAAKASVIVPGAADASELIRRISAEDAGDRMPPPEAEKAPLTPEQVETFRRWIDQGAQWDRHWAFEKPERPDPPKAGDDWAQNAIDRFVYARLKDEGLTPSPEADRETLIRRVSLDLTGLPPTIDEIEAFLADDAPDAYEKVVDRLLASKHYGERMAVDWLDGARYADTNGFQNDFRREMWLWRDWVINALNDNMPFDQFAIEQLAGDLLPNATKSQRIATGFNRNNRSNTEGGSIEAEWRVENIVDRVETTSTVFLGLTMGCARCHDHKYDPITQREFYEFFAFFNSTADKGFYEETRGNTGPQVEVRSPENERKIAEFDKAIEKATADLSQAMDAAPGFIKWVSEIKTSTNESPPPPVFTAPLTGHMRVTASGGAAGKVTAQAGADATEWAEGLTGPALALKGTPSSYIDFGSAVATDNDTAFTLAAWVRPDEPGALFSQNNQDGRGLEVRITDNGRIAVQLAHTPGENAIRVLTDGRLDFETWSHVAVAYDGSAKAKGVTVYVSGSPAAIHVDQDSLTESITNEKSFHVGSNGKGPHLKGAVNGFQFFARPLTHDEAASITRAALAPVLSEPLNPERRAMLDQYFELRRSYYWLKEQRTAERLKRERTKYIDENVPTVMVMEELDEPRPTYLLTRGEYDKPDKSEELHPSVPNLLPPLPEDAPRDRLGLAKWIVSEDNPLTARVTMNRLWRKFFGKGLVKSPENFGVQSEPPSHPGLLDWLATEFMQNGWDLKGIQRTIVMSATYRQSSDWTDKLRETDPENRLLARGPRFRMKAELVRDNALAVSGLLADKIGGPSVKPYQPEGLWEELAGGASQGPYVQSEGEDLYRRSLYTYRKRTVPHPTLTTFDAPGWDICRVKRSRTNTPLQALALLNGVTYVEASRHLAERMLEEAGPEDDQRIQFGFRLATGRLPTDTELQILKDGLAKYMKTYTANPQAAEQFINHGESPVDSSADNSTLAAYTALASVILNLDETITKT